MMSGWSCPKAIVFDYGRTLVTEPDHDHVRGIRDLLDTVRAENGACPTAEEYLDAREELAACLHKVHAAGIDLPETKLMRLLFAKFGIRTDLPDVQLETVLWNGISMGRPTDGMAQVLRELTNRGITVAVVSNAEYSGQAMQLRLERLFPEVCFDAVITSSDYLFRKPNPLLFWGIAAKLDLAPNQIWFCGDDAYADIEGAVSVGMRGVLYRKFAKADQLGPVLLPSEAVEIYRIESLLEMLK